MAIIDNTGKSWGSRLLDIPLVNHPPNKVTIMLISPDGIGITTPPLFITFPVNPESLMSTKKYLMTITNTMGGGWVDDFGVAPAPLTINGTFGYNTKAIIGGIGYSGFGWTKYLEWLVDQSHIPNLDGKFPEVWLLSWISQHFYKVTLDTINISQNVNRNNLWVYSLQITALEPIVPSGIQNVVLKKVDDIALGGAVTEAVQTVKNNSQFKELASIKI